MAAVLAFISSSLTFSDVVNHLGRRPTDAQVLSRASEAVWTAKDAIDWQGDQFWQGITARATGLLSSKRVGKIVGTQVDQTEPETRSSCRRTGAPMGPWTIDCAVADFDIVLDVASGTRLSPRNYLHGGLDAHHRHRDAPPDQQEEGRSLKP
jgi:hypothetical protein